MFCTNLVEESVVLETIIDICQIFVMQLNHLPDKNLKANKISFNPFQHCSQYLHLELENSPVLANQPHPFYLPVKKNSRKLA
jgi:hypothetical protein